MTTKPVLFEEKVCLNGKKIGIATLNTPKSLNAISVLSTQLLLKQLALWRDDENIAAVVLTGSGDRAFCAGGDVRAIHFELEEKGLDTDISQFFISEYDLDYTIHTFTKPIVCWGDGLVMGGGLGLMVGASHRVVTERTVVSMPEVFIGIFPDVGATCFLNRMPGNLGQFVGLTGLKCSASDALFLGIADFAVESSAYDALLSILRKTEWLEDRKANYAFMTEALRQLSQSTPAKLQRSPIREHADFINDFSQHNSAASLHSAMMIAKGYDDWSEQVIEQGLKGSALSFAVTFEQIKRGKNMTYPDAFRKELDMMVNMTSRQDFAEGIKAVLVHKHNQPKWEFDSIASINQSLIDGIFKSPWNPENHPLRHLGTY